MAEAMADGTARSAGKLRKSAVLALGLLFLLALPAGAEALGEPFYVTMASRILIYALAAVSLDLIVGYGGLVSLGHGAFYGLGGYTVGILGHHAFEGTPIGFLPGDWGGTTSALIQFPAALCIGALAAVIIGALSLRTTGVYFIMITLAFAQMLFFFFVGLSPYGGADGLNVWERSTVPFLDLYDETHFYYLCLGLLVAFVILSRRIVDARFGMVLRAIKQNESRLRALGVPTFRTKLMAFVIAGAGGALAGALAANHTEFVGPGMMHWTKSGEFLVMVILGGLGTLYGPVFGAAALILLEDYLSAITEHWMIVLGPVLILIVLVFRRGVYGMLAGPEARDG